MTTPDSEKQLACTQALLAILQEKRLAVAELESIGLGQGRGRDAMPATSPQLRTLAAECARQNEVNGGMVEAGLRHTQHVLAILHGQSPEAGLYSRAGTSLGTSRPRPLTSA
jgi:flagellar biosynthesis/type III secretory pathway chaperone